MPLVPEPCFIQQIRKNSGSKRVLVYVTNNSPAPVTQSIRNVVKPEWIDIEKAMIGDSLTWKKMGKVPLVVNINTDHRFFPSEKSVREEVKFEFESGDPLNVFIYLQEIISEVANFRGTFAMDFGTTNTCYAWKSRVGEGVTISDLVKPPEVSREIPTLVRFKDISNRMFPLVEIGNHARDYIAHNSGKSFTYAVSIKRLMGMDKEIVILDERSGMEPDRFQKYHPEEISSFIIKEFLRDAESRIGEKLTEVVATFPILYSRKKRTALRRAMQLAWEGLNREWKDELLILRLDETNAAGFNYIYQTLLNEFRRTTIQEKKHRLLSYDFGGGTVDVSLVDVDLTREVSGRIQINTKVLGLTGDAYLGGDNITAAALKILKHKLTLRIVAARWAVIDAARKEAAEAAAGRGKKAEASSNNPWAIPSGNEPAKASDDPWGSLGADEKKAEAAAAPVVEEEEEDPETADITNLTSDLEQEKAIELIAGNRDVLELACTWGVPLAETLSRMAANGVKKLAAYEIKELGQQLQDAEDLLLPTKWSVLEKAGDLITKDTAKKLFYELWMPTEVMKIKAVLDDGRTATLSEPLHKIAKYAGVRTDDLMGITLTEDELNAAIEPNLRRSIRKAWQLSRSIDSTQNTGGISFGFGSLGSQEERPMTILLAGNSARLPIVRKLVTEIFEIDNDRVVMDPAGVKATVAQGACEEHILFRDFGEEGGLISYKAGDFTGAIPYALGLFQRELSLIGYAGGFAPVMPRGTVCGSQVLLTDALQVVHKKATELNIFAYFHDHKLGADKTDGEFIDGVEPTNLGWFDLTKAEPTLWSGEFSPDVQAGIAALGSSFGLVLDLDENRHMTLINPIDKKCYKLKEAPEQCLDVDNPFSGIH